MRCRRGELGGAHDRGVVLGLRQVAVRGGGEAGPVAADPSGSHSHVGTSRNKLGLVLQDLGDLAGARAHYERAFGLDDEWTKTIHTQLDEL